MSRSLRSAAAAMTISLAPNEQLGNGPAPDRGAGGLGLSPGWSAVLDGPDDLAQQRGELVLLVLGQAGADKRLADVERGEQPLDHTDALGLQADEHQPAIGVVRPPPGQAALF